MLDFYRCLDYPHSAISEEFHLKNHWKIILAGARGAGMFNHSDTLLTSSWHAHLTGRKWWYVCGPKGNCFEDYLMPGEVLYYGPHWHHETQNIITPTITITDTVAFDGNYKGLALKLHHECTTSKTGMLFSASHALLALRHTLPYYTMPDHTMPYMPWFLLPQTQPHAVYVWLSFY